MMAFPRLYTNILLLDIILLASISYSISDQEKKQDIIHDHDHDPHAVIKCGSCPCVNPCGQQRPPPPPPKVQCSPAVTAAPPPPRFIYVTSVPEQPWQANIIPNNNNWQYFYSTATRKMVPENYLFFFSVFYALLQLLAFG